MAGSFHAKTVFITGTSRGIGLEFVKQLTHLSEPPKHIFATCRNPDAAKDLQDIASKHPSVHVGKFDATDYASYSSTVSWVEKILGDDGLNVLINNAGVYQKDASFGNVTRDQMLADIDLNTIAPLMLTQAFVPLLKKAAAAAASGAGMSCSRAAVINITSKMGSIDDNTSGKSYSYRASKAGQNMVTKCLSIDLKADGILAMALHPGWVKTDMGTANALVSTETCVSGLLRVMAGLKDADTGRFLDYKGESIPW